MPDWIPYIAVFLTGLVVTMLCVPFAKTLATKLGAIDYPSARRINKTPIPRMGGVAMFLGLSAAVIVQYAGTTYFDWPVVLIPHVQLQGVDYKILALSVLVVFLTGALDDVMSLKPSQKLLGQVLAACIAAAAGLVIGNVSNPFTQEIVPIGWLAYPITVVYLVAFSNIINLIDGLDGLAAGITGISCTAMAYIALQAGRLDAAALSIALIGVCLGFLRFNFHPASIFMGDSGALTLGFLLGVVALLGVNRVAAATTLIVPLVIAGVPIIDTFAAIVRRKRANVSFAQADKGHIQHRLIKRGLNQRQAALAIYAWSFLLCVGAVVMTKVEIGWRVVVVLTLLAFSFAFVIKLHLFEPVLLHRINKKTGQDELVDKDDLASEDE